MASAVPENIRKQFSPSAGGLIGWLALGGNRPTMGHHFLMAAKKLLVSFIGHSR